MEIYRRHGVDFLRLILANFPKGEQTIDSAHLLDELEAISPGWKQWAVRVEAGDLQSIDLAPENSRPSGASTNGLAVRRDPM
jgi:hypothetical protein